MKTCTASPSTHILQANPATDTTGPSSAKQGILLIYDIFGFFDQTLQGADIIAHSDNEHQYQVFMPDFFDGSPADVSSVVAQS